MPGLRRGTYSYKQRLIFSKSIDVRGKTLAQIQSEGWNLSVVEGSYTLDSNGLSVGGQNNSVALYYQGPTLTTNNTIEFKYTGYCTSAEDTSKYGGICYLGLFGTITTSFYQDFMGGTYNSGYNTSGGYTGIIYNNNYLQTGYRNKGGNISYSIKINLSTGLCTYHITSPVSEQTLTTTLNSTQITNILTKSYFGTILYQYTSGYILRVHTAEFKIS